MKKLVLLVVLLALLAACAPQGNPQPVPEAGIDSPPTAEYIPSAQPEPTESPQKMDDQGQVTVVVTPLNLDPSGETLVFEVAMDTHSVDLSFDLLRLASLQTDTGRIVDPLAWDAPSGGHHLSGKLTFPASYDGKPLLDGAQELSLILREVNVPMRLFTWRISR